MPGESGRGVSRYDGKAFTVFTARDGLANGNVYSMFEDSAGNLWFGTYSGGVSRYDGVTFTTFTTEDGLAHNTVCAILEDRVGNLWFGTGGGGLHRYDGHTFTTFTDSDGLATGSIQSIFEDSIGNLWVGTARGGVRRYDGKTFTTFNTDDGLAGNWIRGIVEDNSGDLWFGAYDGGVSRYDGHTFTNFTTQDGLAHNSVNSMIQDTDGHLWFATDGGVVSRYDGQVFQTLTSQDGLTGCSIRSMLQDGAGNFWFATEGGGVTRYRPASPSPPTVFIDAVVANRRHEGISELTIPASAELVSFEFHAINLKTRPEAMVYRYRLRRARTSPAPTGIDEWKNTYARHVEYQNLPQGDYTFELQAVDRDLVYSEIVKVNLSIIPDPREQRIAVLESDLEIRNRELEKINARLTAELQDARRVQMSLMPETSPEIAGQEIFGRCVPANTVSGDFFDYLERHRENEIVLVVGDVTGKAMKGAMNAVMADGILHSIAHNQADYSPASLLMGLNNVLKARIEREMNVTMVIVLINAETKTVTLANAAHHAHPLLLRDGKVESLKLGGFPLGMKAGITYREQQFPLQRGDVLVLMTDGIIEAMDGEGTYYGDTEGLEGVLSQFTPQMSAEAMVDAVIADAIDHGGGNREDDMTVVVAKVL